MKIAVLIKQVPGATFSTPLKKEPLNIGALTQRYSATASSLTARLNSSLRVIGSDAIEIKPALR